MSRSFHGIHAIWRQNLFILNVTSIHIKIALIFLRLFSPENTKVTHGVNNFILLLSFFSLLFGETVERTSKWIDDNFQKKEEFNELSNTLFSFLLLLNAARKWKAQNEIVALNRKAQLSQDNTIKFKLGIEHVYQRHRYVSRCFFSSFVRRSSSFDLIDWLMNKSRVCSVKWNIFIYFFFLSKQSRQRMWENKPQTI